MMVGRRDNPCPPPRLPLLSHETGLTDEELDLLCDLALNEMKLEKREAKVARDMRKRENFDTIEKSKRRKI